MGSVDIPFVAHDVLAQLRGRRAFSRDDRRSKNSTTALLYDEEGDAKGIKRERDTEKGNGNLPLQIRALVIRKKSRTLANVSMLSACRLATFHSRVSQWPRIYVRHPAGVEFILVPAEGKVRKYIPPISTARYSSG